MLGPSGRDTLRTSLVPMLNFCLGVQTDINKMCVEHSLRVRPVKSEHHWTQNPKSSGHIPKWSRYRIKCECLRAKSAYRLWRTFLGPNSLAARRYPDPPRYVHMKYLRPLQEDSFQVVSLHATPSRSMDTNRKFKGAVWKLPDSQLPT